MKSVKKLEYFDTGELASEEWVVEEKCTEGYSHHGIIGNGVNSRKFYHRTDGPAYTLYTPDGRLVHQSWFFENNSHRLDGPAGVRYYYSEADLSIAHPYEIEIIDLDSVLEWPEDCLSILCHWWVDGESMEFSEWLQLCTLSDAEKVEMKLRYG